MDYEWEMLIDRKLKGVAKGIEKTVLVFPYRRLEPFVI